MASFADLTRKLIITVANDGDGTQKTKTRTFAGLSETAPAADVMKAGRAFGSLMKQEVVAISVADKNAVIYDGDEAHA